MKKIFCILLCFFLFFLHSDIFASNFEDNFDELTLDLSKWNYYEDYDQTIKIANSYLTLPAVTTNKIPFIYALNYTLPNNFFLTYKFKYGPLSDHGIGLILAYSNLDLYNFMHDQVQYRVLSIWNENFMSGFPLRFQVFASKCYTWVYECENTKTYFIGDQLNNVNEYEAQITKIDNKITVNFYDMNNFVNYSFPAITLDNGIKVNHIFIGHPPILEVRNDNQKLWSTLNVDYVRVTELPSSSTKSPIIFLPGYMASFQWEDLKDNTSTHEWTRNPVEKVYNNFFDTLKNLGYTEGTDLVRYDYDFRRPLPEISQKFTGFLNNFLSSWPQNTKVILIGHSFGGLLAKQYVHDNSASNIEKVVTVGTPHEGVLDVYPIIAAGDMTDADIWQKAAYETISIFNGKNFLNNRQVVENIIPSVHDLLPIFDDYYLKNAHGDTISSSLNNPNLTILKNTFSFPELFKIVRGTGKNTKRFYVLESRSAIDQALGNYPDGKIKQTEYSSAGDGTVLTKSADISGVHAESLSDQNHVQIISAKKGIKKVLELAGISYTDDNIVENPVPSIPQALLFLLRSPAEIKVTDLQTGKSIGSGSLNLIENAVSMENNKFVLVPTADGKNYKIEVIGTGNGKYQLDISAISEATSSSSLSFYKDIKNGASDSFDIKYYEQANLISLNGSQIINPHLSLKSTLTDLNKYISTSSASLQLKKFANSSINDLLSDADLIKVLSEEKNRTEQAALQDQKMLLKTFLLEKNLNPLNHEEKIQVLNKVLAVALAEKELFVALNNKVISTSYGQTSASLDNLVTIKESVKDQLEQKLLRGEADEFNAANYDTAENIFNLASREFSSLLYPNAFFSSQISRHLLNASLE